MINTKIMTICLVVVGLAVMDPGPVVAGFRPGTLIIGAISLEQAVRMVQGSAGGRILGAETRNVGGRTVYIIKVLTPDGKRVRNIQVDAESGRIVGGG